MQSLICWVFKMKLFFQVVGSSNGLNARRYINWPHKLELVNIHFQWKYNQYEFNLKKKKLPNTLGKRGKLNSGQHFCEVYTGLHCSRPSIHASKSSERIYQPSFRVKVSHPKYSCLCKLRSRAKFKMPPPKKGKPNWKDWGKPTFIAMFCYVYWSNW